MVVFFMDFSKKRRFLLCRTNFNNGAANNNSNNNGGVIRYDGLLRTFAEKIGGDFYILH